MLRTKAKKVRSPKYVPVLRLPPLAHDQTGAATVGYVGYPLAMVPAPIFQNLADRP